MNERQFGGRESSWPLIFPFPSPRRSRRLPSSSKGIEDRRFQDM